MVTGGNSQAIIFYKDSPLGRLALGANLNLWLDLRSAVFEGVIDEILKDLRQLRLGSPHCGQSSDVHDGLSFADAGR